jgi:hypothetical protein
MEQYRELSVVAADPTMEPDAESNGSNAPSDRSFSLPGNAKRYNQSFWEESVERLYAVGNLRPTLSRAKIDIPELEAIGRQPARFVKGPAINHPVAGQSLEREPDGSTAPFAELQLQPSA